MTTEGNVVHYRFIEVFIERLGKKCNIHEIAFSFAPILWGTSRQIRRNPLRRSTV